MALGFGGAIHKALDVWYQHKNMDQAIAVFEDNFTEDLKEDTKRTTKVGQWIIKNYHEQYVKQPLELVASEFAFEVPMDGDIFMGRIDKIVKFGGALWVMDHKTTSMLGASFTNTIEPNGQFMGYVYAARHLGYPVVGVLLDAILVAKGLLDSAQRARLTPLLRYDAFVSNEKLQEWMGVVKDVIGDVKSKQTSGQWIPNWSMCSYYGSCPYRKVCIEEEGLRERILAMDYEYDMWDPRDED